MVSFCRVVFVSSLLGILLCQCCIRIASVLHSYGLVSVFGFVVVSESFGARLTSVMRSYRSRITIVRDPHCFRMSIAFELHAYCICMVLVPRPY